MSSSFDGLRRSVAGIAIRRGRVFVGLRKSGGDLGGKWEFPGGKLEPGETDDQALVREFNEEFGLIVNVGRLLGESDFAHGGHRYSLAALALDFRGEPPELREHDEVRWVDATELCSMDLAESDRTLLSFILPLLVE
ncbi:MAG: (deoxy)nucleoside triphosphate pyrophosphohydrolase [Spirochaetales bacterium]|nr:MAG: (deoxy)nucleoside triphosphate pyrophosphohydrolase [Spirochaetales bacterium]